MYTVDSGSLGKTYRPDRKQGRLRSPTTRDELRCPGRALSQRQQIVGVPVLVCAVSPRDSSYLDNGFWLLSSYIAQ